MSVSHSGRRLAILEGNKLIIKFIKPSNYKEDELNFEYESKIELPIKKKYIRKKSKFPEKSELIWTQNDALLAIKLNNYQQVFLVHVEENKVNKKIKVGKFGIKKQINSIQWRAWDDQHWELFLLDQIGFVIRLKVNSFTLQLENHQIHEKDRIFVGNVFRESLSMHLDILDDRLYLSGSFPHSPPLPVHLSSPIVVFSLSPASLNHLLFYSSSSLANSPSLFNKLLSLTKPSTSIVQVPPLSSSSSSSSLSPLFLLLSFSLSSISLFLSPSFPSPPPLSPPLSPYLSHQSPFLLSFSLLLPFSPLLYYSASRLLSLPVWSFLHFLPCIYSICTN